MVAPVLREPALVWSCVALAGGCLAAAVAVRARKFLRELSEQFIRLPPSGKAVLAAAVVVATVFAQKPTNVSTNQHESTQAEEGVSATPSEKPAALNTEETEVGRHGEGSEGGDPTVASTTPTNSPCLTNSVTSRPLARPSGSPSAKVPSETLCVSSAHVLSESNPPVVTSNDVARGYRLETVGTNAAISYTRPMNARLVGTWHRTDAYRARARAQLLSTNLHESAPISICDDSCQFVANSPRPFRFPIGGHVVTSLWAHTWGKVRPQLRNASNEIVVIGSPMFARHDQSYLWTAATANGSVLLTWENFFLGNPYERLSTNLHESTRIPIRENSCQFVDHPPVNAQLELFPNGDFIARSNEVERVYRRVNPDDWDDDGIPNDEDPAPLAPAGAPQFGPHQTLPEGANSNAYCWVDLVVRQANALVTFTGDGASNLADPSFIAETDATNRVTLLIGKTYRVTCPMPFEIAAKSSDDIEDSWEEDGAALWLHWPVAIRSQSSESRARAKWLSTNLHESTRISIRENSCQFVANQTTDGLPPGLLTSFLQTYAAGSSRPFTMQVTPFGLGGAFTWTNVCCRVSGSAYTFSITCGDSCSCGGCSATGYLEYEGYRLPAYGGSCGCSGSVDHPGDAQDPDKDPPLPGASATFSKRVVFFEDEYENAPGETVPWRSTETDLDCWAYGGTRGGHVRIEIRGADGLVQYGGSPLPFECDLEPGEEVAFKNTYRAVRPSGGEDAIVVTATFTENETDWSQTTIDKATAIRLEFDAVAEAPTNKSPGRRKLGVRERLNCFQYPSSPSVEWVTLGGGSMSAGGHQFQCPLRAATNPLIARCQGVEYAPFLHVVEPEGIEVRNVTPVTYGVATNHAGGIGMRFELFLKPFDVSFSEIAVEEIPCERGERTGYFNRPEFVSLQSHTTLNGAGRWMNVSEEDNGYGLDYAEIDSEIPRVKPSGEFTSELQYGWTDGTVLWPIPSGWGEKDRVKGDVPEAEIQESVTSLMTIQTSGRSGIRKFRHQVTRDIDGTIFLDGVQAKEADE